MYEETGWRSHFVLLCPGRFALWLVKALSLVSVAQRMHLLACIWRRVWEAIDQKAPTVPALRTVYHKRSQSQGLCHAKLHCFEVLEKSPSRRVCLVSQIPGSVTRVISHFYGRMETPFTLHYPYHMWYKHLCFLWLWEWTFGSWRLLHLCPPETFLVCMF